MNIMPVVATTQAAVLRDRSGAFVIEDVQLPELGPGDILVRIAAAGMCHSDLVVRDAGGEPMRPAIFGHEGSGIVEETGAAVTRVRRGDHVVLSYDWCGWCEACLRGHQPYCAEHLDRNSTGFGLPGARLATDRHGQDIGSRWFAQSSFAHHAVATERNAVVVESDLPLELLGPLGCGLQTGAGAVLNVLRPRVDESIVIFGTGALGLAAIMAARASGAGMIVAVDIHPARRELALELGADAAYDGNDPDLAAILASRHSGMHLAMDTTGRSTVATTAIASLRVGGRLALFGAAPLDLHLAPIDLLGRSLSYIIQGEAVPQLFIPLLVRLWQQGRFPFDKLVRRYPFADINDAERDSVDGRTVKPVLVMP
jgi:aryl-alcohol dehydrogenase